MNLHIIFILTVAQVRLKWCPVRKSAPVNALSLQPLVPANTGPEDARPRNHATDGGHIRDCSRISARMSRIGPKESYNSQILFQPRPSDLPP